MMKSLSLFLLIASCTFPALGQDDGAGHHRVVMQLTSGDTVVHKGLMRQLDNLLDAAPDARVEVVCHGPGLELLVGDRTRVAGPVARLSERGIVFLACENTLRRWDLDGTDLLPQAGTVNAGILHLVERQEEDWSYIKAGF